MLVNSSERDAYAMLMDEALRHIANSLPTKIYHSIQDVSKYPLKIPNWFRQRRICLRGSVSRGLLVGQQ